ncbi:MAG TPA: biopolymer transporter ExbD [Rickettsiales bacterium]|nr:biopolymer transporter ExbD [Rickettsiales bacterium]
MAMGSFDRDDLHAPLAEINATPLVDVLLVLVVIFLVTAPLLNNTIKLELPHEAAAHVTEQKAVVLSVNAGGQYYIDEKAVTSEQLEEQLQQLATKDTKQPLHIRADESVAYSKVSHLLALASRFGLGNIGFVTQPKNP